MYFIKIIHIFKNNVRKLSVLNDARKYVFRAYVRIKTDTPWRRKIIDCNIISSILCITDTLL